VKGKEGRSPDISVLIDTSEPPLTPTKKLETELEIVWTLIGPESSNLSPPENKGFQGLTLKAFKRYFGVLASVRRRNR